MNKEAQLNEFFENGMSPAEEQNFLISVAASDELRIAFRSHLELMKAVRSDKDNLRSVAQVRNRTLAALGLSATAASQFVEHELIQGKKDHADVISEANAAKPMAAEVPSTGLRTPGMQWVGHLLHAPALTIGAGLLLGILSTTAVEHYMNPGTTVAPSHVASQPAASAQPIETIPAQNGLHNTGESSFNERSPISHAAPVVHRARMAMHHTAKVAAPEPLKASANSGIPEVRKNNPGVMQSHKLLINQTNDTAKAKK